MVLDVIAHRIIAMSGLFKSLSNFGSSAQIAAEKARLEAFLSAVPGEYCGWASDGSVAYSKGFCDAFGLEVIEKITDLQNKLCPEDSASLESLFGRLVQNNIPFTINVETRGTENTLKLSGTRGQDLSGNDYFHILWLEDITDLKSASEKMEQEHSNLHNEMAMLQESLDALPHPVWLRDENQKITWCNIAYAKMVEAPPSDIMAQQKEIIPTDRKRKPSEKGLLFGSELALSAQEKGTIQTTKIHEVLAGKRLLLKLSEVPVKGQNTTLGMAEDMTDQERLMEEVENNRSANRALLEQLRSSIGIYDSDQKLQFYNSSFAQLWGLEEGWLNTRPKLGDVMEKLRETRRLPEQVDFRSFKKSWTEMFTSLIDPRDDMLYLPDGSALRMLVVPHKLGGLMMIFEDVTSRLALESSYNTLIAVQKETLDNLEEGVVVYGGDGRVKLWNPSFATLWDLAPETLEGEPHITKIIDKAKAFFESAEWATTQERMLSLGLERAMHAGRLSFTNGKLIDYSTVPLPDGGVMITYADVTDTVRVEKALREKNIALEAAEKLKLDFLANVSYQLRTPLNAIMGFNEMLTQEFFGPLNDKQKEYTGDIQGASERLLALVNNILDLSTIEAGQMTLDIEKTSIKSMMENTLDLVEDWARKEKIEVILKCPANIGSAEIDESRVKQALVNLVRNSISHTEAGGVIHMIAGRSAEDIKITVKDNGTGIDEVDQQRVLEPFERTGGQASERGAGLGLALVRNIVDLHKGSLSLQSEAGEGTEVIMIFPKSQDS